MSNELFVLVVTYSSLCVGTFITLKEPHTNFFEVLLKSILLPLPVIAVILCVAVHVVFDKSVYRSSIPKIFLIFLISITSYSEALKVLKVDSNVHKSSIFTVKYCKKIKVFSSIVRNDVANNIVSA